MSYKIKLKNYTVTRYKPSKVNLGQDDYKNKIHTSVTCLHVPYISARFHNVLDFRNREHLIFQSDDSNNSVEAHDKTFRSLENIPGLPCARILNMLGIIVEFRYFSLRGPIALSSRNPRIRMILYF